jgi:hypothetical protein
MFIDKDYVDYRLISNVCAVITRKPVFFRKNEHRLGILPIAIGRGIRLGRSGVEFPGRGVTLIVSKNYKCNYCLK